MSDRLTELRRQRALAQQQVEWFDREIAALEGAAPKPAMTPGPAPVTTFHAAPVPATPVATPQPTVTASAPAAAVAFEFAEYEADPASMQAEAKRGCLLYAGLALAAFFIALVALYFLAYRDHPVFFASPPAKGASGKMP